MIFERFQYLLCVHFDASFGDSATTVMHVMHTDLLPWTVAVMVTFISGVRTQTTSFSIEYSIVSFRLLRRWCFEAAMQIATEIHNLFHPYVSMLINCNR